MLSNIFKEINALFLVEVAKAIVYFFNFSLVIQIIYTIGRDYYLLINTSK